MTAPMNEKKKEFPQKVAIPRIQEEALSTREENYLSCFLLVVGALESM